MTSGTDRSAAIRWDERRKLAGWALDTTGMAKSGYAPRKATLAQWVCEAVEAIDDAEARVAALEEQIRSLRESYGRAVKA